MNEWVRELFHIKRGDSITECYGELMVTRDGTVKIVNRTPEVLCKCQGSIIVYQLKEKAVPASA